MNQTSLFSGLKIYILVSSLFGIKCFLVKQKNLLWVNTVQSLYNNCLLIAEVTFIPAYIMVVFCYEIGNFQATSSNSFNNGMNDTIVVSCRLIWVAILTFTTIYTRIYWKHLVKSIKKLTHFLKHFCGKLKENYFTFFLCLVLNCNYLVIFFSNANFNEMNDNILYWTRLAYIFYGQCFPIIFCNLFFCVVQQLLLIAKELDKEISLWENRRLTIYRSSKKSHLKFHKESKTTDIDNFKQKLYMLLNITDGIVDYFQIPVSLIFLNNLLFVILEVTRITTTSSYKPHVILPLTFNLLQVSVILYFGDAVYRKVRKSSFSYFSLVPTLVIILIFKLFDLFTCQDIHFLKRTK